MIGHAADFLRVPAVSLHSTADYFLRLLRSWLEALRLRRMVGDAPCYAPHTPPSLVIIVAFLAF